MRAVVQIADYAAPYGGNFIAALTALAGPCRQHGLRLVLTFPCQSRERAWCADLSAGGYAVRFLPAARSLLGQARAIRRIARQENAALIHTHFTRFDLAAWLAARLPARGRRPQVIWHAHSALHDPRTRLRRLKNLVKYRGLGRTARMIAVSEHVRRELLAVGFPSARIRTILNGIDLQRASRTVRSKEQVFSDLGIQPDQRLLLMIGWDPIRKGVDLAGEAVGRLVEQGERLVLVILGGEPLRRYLSERKPGGAPPWMRCIEPTEDMGSLYGAAAAFLSPSRSEGFTYAACEAMAGGTPAVLADIPAVGWAQACPAAAFCAPGDGHALCAAIRSVLSWSPVERQRRAAEGRQFVRRGFDVRRWAEQVVEFYHERQ